jgi:hypothetical protein
VYDFYPQWSVEAGAVFMHRSSPQGAPIIGADGPFDVAVEDSDTGWASGPRVKIGRNVRYLGRVELAYFGFYDGASPYRARTTWQGLDSQQTEDILTDFWSDLHSTELNVRRPLIGELDWLAGFRWIEFQDRMVGFQVETEIPGAIELRDPAARVYNHVYGFQLGVDGTLWRFSPKLRATGFLKSGIYGDAIQAAASVNALVEETEDSQTTQSWKHKSLRDEEFSHLTFVGELGIGGEYQIGEHLSATIGYQALWLEGVATLPAFLSAGRESWAHGSPFFHGVVLGLEAAW